MNNNFEGDFVTELRLNVDDMTAEELGFAMEKIYEAGALECFFTPVTMKKCRPGTLVTILVRDEKKDAVIFSAFKHTNTIGIRESVCKRYTLSRHFETVETEKGSVRKKISEGYGVRREKLEFDDLAKIANENNISLKEARALAQSEK